VTSQATKAAVSRAFSFGKRAAGGPFVLVDSDHSAIELRIHTLYSSPPYSTFRSYQNIPRPRKLPDQCTGPCLRCLPSSPQGLIGLQGSPGPAGPAGPGSENPFAVGDWVWARDFRYRSVVRGTVKAISSGAVYLLLEWPLPYLGDRGVMPCVSASKLTKPSLLERIAFAASEDGELYRYRKGFRIRLLKQEFLEAIS
jgi:hypothetical protein